MPIYGKRARYLSSVHNRYPAIYAGRQVLSEILNFLPNPTFSSCKMRFIDNLLDDKTIILLYLAEYRLILAKFQEILRAISQYNNC